MFHHCRHIVMLPVRQHPEGAAHILGTTDSLYLLWFLPAVLDVLLSSLHLTSIHPQARYFLVPPFALAPSHPPGCLSFPRCPDHETRASGATLRRPAAAPCLQRKRVITVWSPSGICTKLGVGSRSDSLRYAKACAEKKSSSARCAVTAVARVLALGKAVSSITTGFGSLPSSHVMFHHFDVRHQTIAWRMRGIHDHNITNVGKHQSCIVCIT